MKRVYFIKPVGMDGPVKIGCSLDPVKRLKELMVWSPFRLEIVAIIPGGYDMEASLQGMFGRDRLHGEWFAFSERMGEVIKHIRAGGDIARIFGEELAEGKSSMRVASGIKSHLTKRVNKAEKAAIRAGIHPIRPDWVRQAISEYTGPDKPIPTPEHRALLDLYVRQLREFPSRQSPAEAA